MVFAFTNSVSSLLWDTMNAARTKHFHIKLMQIKVYQCLHGPVANGLGKWWTQLIPQQQTRRIQNYLARFMCQWTIRCCSGLKIFTWTTVLSSSSINNSGNQPNSQVHSATFSARFNKLEFVVCIFSVVCIWMIHNFAYVISVVHYLEIFQGPERGWHGKCGVQPISF